MKARPKALCKIWACVRETVHVFSESRIGAPKLWKDGCGGAEVIRRVWLLGKVDRLVDDQKTSDDKIGAFHGSA
jgi:hypothetical protein